MASPQNENPSSPVATTTVVNVQYNVVNDGVVLSRMKLAIPQGSSAQNVMEMGANINKSLRFRVKYYNNELGYLLGKIGTIGNQPPPGPRYIWIMYVSRGSNLQPSPVGISYWIPPPNSTVEMRYELSPKDHPLHGFQEYVKIE